MAMRVRSYGDRRPAGMVVEERGYGAIDSLCALYGCETSEQLRQALFDEAVMREADRLMRGGTAWMPVVRRSIGATGVVLRMVGGE